MAYEFDVYDYLISSLVLLISIFIGLYQAIIAKYGSIAKIFKRKTVDENFEARKKINEYLTANSTMYAIPISFSLLATFFSATILVGLPAEVYQYGIEFFLEAFAIMLTPIIGAFVTGPMFARLKIVSVFAYFRLRYNSDRIRLTGTTMYMIRTFISTGIFIFGPATAITALTSLNTATAIILVGGVATFYTTIGGIKAVIWTDLFQMIIMFAGVIAVLIKGTIDVGGVGELWRINSEGGRLNLFDFNPNPLVRQSFWSLTVGMFFYFFGPYCLDQQMLQRYVAAKNKKQAQFSLLLNVPGVFLLIGLTSACGLVIYASYANCDPMSSPHITNVRNPNQLMIYLVTDKMGVIRGFTGLFLASIISGSLSSVSSSLNSVSAIIWEDCLKRFQYFSRLSDSRSTLVVKLLVVLNGFVSTGFAIVVSTLGGNLIQVSSALNGAMGAPITGAFFLAGLFPFTNEFGVFFGMISGLAVGIWVSYGAFVFKPNYPKLSVNADCYKNITSFTNAYVTTTKLGKVASNLTGFSQFYGLAFTWFSTLGIITTLIVGIVVSLATGGYKDSIDDNVMLLRFFKSKKSKNIKNEDESNDFKLTAL